MLFPKQRFCLHLSSIPSKTTVQRPFCLQTKQQIFESWVKASDLENECRRYKNMPQKERVQIINAVLNSGLQALHIRRKMKDPTVTRIAADPLPQSTIELIHKLQKNQKRHIADKLTNAPTTAPVKLEHAGNNNNNNNDPSMNHNQHHNFSTKIQNNLAIALQLAKNFEKANLLYAIGGALAYNMYGVPRATIDVDINVFVETSSSQFEKVIETLKKTGIVLNEQTIQDAKDLSRLVFMLRNVQVEIFFNLFKFQEEAIRTRVKLAIGRTKAYFLSAEAICAAKMLYFRPKDLNDVERILFLQKDTFDFAYTRKLITMSLLDPHPEENERVLKFDELSRLHCKDGHKIHK